MSETRFEHEPVMAREALELLEVESGGFYLDATVGGGGHAALILESSPATRLLGLDQDPEAVAAAKRRLTSYGERVRIVEGNFRDAARMTEAFGESYDWFPRLWRGLAKQLREAGRNPSKK